MIFKTLGDKPDAEEVRKHEDRLRKRLQRFGYRISSRVKETSKANFRRPKRTPKKKGYQVTDIVTDAVVCGEGYKMTLKRLEGFWSYEYSKQQRRKMEEKQKKSRGNA